MVSTILCSCYLSSVRPQASSVCIWRINFCTALLAIHLVVLAVCNSMILFSPQERKKKPKTQQNFTPKFPKKRKKTRTFPSPLEREPLPCPWGCLCAWATKAGLNASTREVGNYAHVRGEMASKSLEIFAVLCLDSLKDLCWPVEKTSFLE